MSPGIYRKYSTAQSALHKAAKHVYTCRSECDNSSKQTESCREQAYTGMYVAEHLSDSAVCVLKRSKPYTYFMELLAFFINLLQTDVLNFTPSVNIKTILFSNIVLNIIPTLMRVI